MYPITHLFSNDVSPVGVVIRVWHMTRTCLMCDPCWPTVWSKRVCGMNRAGLPFDLHGSAHTCSDHTVKVNNLEYNVIDCKIVWRIYSSECLLCISSVIWNGQSYLYDYSIFCKRAYNRTSLISFQMVVKSTLKLWEKLYVEFARLSAMVGNAEPNVGCEELCEKILNAIGNKTAEVPLYLLALCPRGGSDSIIGTCSK